MSILSCAEISVLDLAKHLNCEIVYGDPSQQLLHVDDVSSIKHDSSLCFLYVRKYLEYIYKSQFVACIVDKRLFKKDFPQHIAFLLSDNVKHDMIQALTMMYGEQQGLFQKKGSISSSAVIHDSAVIAKSVYIESGVKIGKDSTIEEGTSVLANVSIGANVQIGENCTLYPNVVLYDHVQLKDHVIIHAGSVIGIDGFGYHRMNQKYVKIPHVGTVEIQSNVEIGANTTIDRAVFGTTTIKDGTKIDNLVHIGHSVQIDDNVIICAQCGFAGSAHLQSDSILTGQSGVADHVTIAKNTIVLGGSKVGSNVSSPGQVLSSYLPARPRYAHLRQLAGIRKLLSTKKKGKIE